MLANKHHGNAMSTEVINDLVDWCYHIFDLSGMTSSIFLCSRRSKCFTLIVRKCDHLPFPFSSKHDELHIGTIANGNVSDFSISDLVD